MPLRVPDSMRTLTPLEGSRDPKEAFIRFNTPVRIGVARREAEVLGRGREVELPFVERDFPGPALKGHWWGSHGPVVLLAHGWSARAATMTAFVDPLLEQGCQVFALDFPGHGDSPGSLCNGYMVSRAWLRAEKEFGPFHGAITHSFGSIGINLFMLNGGGLKQVVHIASFNSVSQRFYEFCLALQFSGQETAEFMGLADDYFGPGRLEEIQVDRICGGFRAQGLLIHDEGDGEILVEASREVASAWPRAELLVTQGLGHFRIIRDKSTVARASEFAARA